MKWEKKGLIFNPTGRYEWMVSHAQVPYPVDFGDYLRIYFATREGYDSHGQCRSYGAFVDVDKNNFKHILRISDRPVIQLGGIGEFDEFGTMPVSVIRIDGLYYMYYTGWTRAVSTPHKEAIGLAVSRNGKYFEKIDKGPLIGDSLHEPYVHNCPVVYQIGSIYHMFYTSGIRWIKGADRMEIQYLIRHATSDNGIEWKMDYKDIIPSQVDLECQNSPTIFRASGKYHMYFCYRCGLDFRNQKGRGYSIGYAYSDDLFDWSRDDSLSGIEMSDTGWDSEMMSYPSIKEIDGKIYMFYCGNHFGRDGFGYAELVEEYPPMPAG